MELLLPDAPPAAPATFAQLYRERYAPMVRLAYLLTSDMMVAEELVQDAFVRVHRRWAQVEDAPAYLRRAVVNACTSHHRRGFLERRHPPAPPEPVTPPEVDELWDVLATLPPRRRAALVLRFYEDLPLADIAAALGCSTGNVKSLLHRGLAQLRGMVEP
jgi:RNA polymerase sigma-70 factor (sigma-E family)